MVLYGFYIDLYSIICLNSILGFIRFNKNFNIFIEFGNNLKNSEKPCSKPC